MWCLTPQPRRLPVWPRCWCRSHPGEFTPQVRLVFGWACPQVPSCGPIPCWHSHVIQSLPAEAFGSPNGNHVGGVVEMQDPLEHRLASGLSSSPHPPSVGTIRTSMSKHHLPLALPSTKQSHVVPRAAGAADGPVVMGRPQSLALEFHLWGFFIVM